MRDLGRYLDITSGNTQKRSQLNFTDMIEQLGFQVRIRPLKGLAKALRRNCKTADEEMTTLQFDHSHSIFHITENELRDHCNTISVLRLYQLPYTLNMAED
ncbi:hypothetical protein SAY87_014112 [Trapa incisa]|uniref:Uncharacterized protein n=1 Tax=Trapa incisa TaxID=236973 RepID=A0AAN7GN82_9MYRT|nr:hypothetical protein SAY87_014112 [Trapa incisa]